MMRDGLTIPPCSRCMGSGLEISIDYDPEYPNRHREYGPDPCESCGGSGMPSEADLESFFGP